MSHHTSDPVCPLCEEKLKTAHPEIARWYRNDVKASYPNAHVAWAYRGKEDQERAFQEHRTKCHYPDSPHNRMVEGRPESLALDLFQIDEDHRALFNPIWYAKLSDECEQKKLPIQWGGTFKTLGDYDHFQLTL